MYSYSSPSSRLESYRKGPSKGGEKKWIQTQMHLKLKDYSILSFFRWILWTSAYTHSPTYKIYNQQTPFFVTFRSRLTYQIPWNWHWRSISYFKELQGVIKLEVLETKSIKLKWRPKPLPTALMTLTHSTQHSTVPTTSAPAKEWRFSSSRPKILIKSELENLSPTLMLILAFHVPLYYPKYCQNHPYKFAANPFSLMRLYQY